MVMDEEKGTPDVDELMAARYKGLEFISVSSDGEIEGTNNAELGKAWSAEEDRFVIHVNDEGNVAVLDADGDAMEIEEKY